MEIYTLDNLHYNSKEVLQVSPEECFEDLSKTIEAITNQLKNSSELEQNMLSFFQREVDFKIAYRDNDVDQGEGGPRRLHLVGKLKKIKSDTGLFVRLGIQAPGEHPLIPSLQALYLLDERHIKYIKGASIGIENDPDRWAYEFSERYQGMVKGANVRTRLGIQSLCVIPAINEVILTGNPKQLETINL